MHDLIDSQLRDLRAKVKPFGITVTMTVIEGEHTITLTANPAIMKQEWWEHYFHSYYEYVSGMLFAAGLLARSMYQVDANTVMVNLGSVFDILKEDYGVDS